MAFTERWGNDPDVREAWQDGYQHGREAAWDVYTKGPEELHARLEACTTVDPASLDGESIVAIASPPDARPSDGREYVLCERTMLAEIIDRIGR